MNRTTAIVVTGILLIVAMLGAWGIFAYVQQAKPATQIPSPLATSTPITATTTTSAGTAPAPANTVHPYGAVTLKMGETARFADVTITPIQVTEDSRCPVDVQCIQAGTVRVSVRIGQGTQIFTLNQAVTTDTAMVTLTSVTPAKNSKTTIGSGDYRLTFDVEKRTVAKQCFIGGCSSEICSDQPGAVSTCIYREAFGCYRTATCERQSSGKCGWTPTKELNTCLANAS